MTIGQRMRQAREDAGMTEDEEFAEQMGVTVATLRAWESDVEAPSDEHLQRFAELTGVDGAALTHLTGSAAPKGICRPVDLVPDRSQTEVLEQVGVPRELWDDSDGWVAFLRLSRAAAKLSSEEISRLADNAEACLLDVET